MPFCTNCGQQIQEGARLCARCGTLAHRDGHKENVQRKFVYDGEIHKCPNCGEVLDSFLANCPACGYELRGVDSTSSVEALAMKLEQIEAKRPPRKTRNVFAQVFSGGQISSIDEQKVGLIKNFSIPNTKEDIMEFIILASSNIDMKVYGVNSQQYQALNPAQREISDAWLAKYEQAYQKAQLMFGGTQDFLNIQSVYERKMREIQRKKRQLPLLWIGTVIGIVVLYGLIFLFLSNAS